MNAFASNTARASAQVLIEPRSPTTARQCREIFRVTAELPKYAHVVRFTEEAALQSTGLPNQPPSQPDPDAIVVPALVSIFDSEVTSLECVTTRPLGYVLPSSSHTFPRKQNPTTTAIGLNAFPDFPIRNQKLKVLIPNGCLQFGTVSSIATAHSAAVDPISCVQIDRLEAYPTRPIFTESYWQALSYVFDRAFHS